jgi:uncharacterized protein
MKLSLSLGIAALLALVPAASAQSPFVAQPLAAGEVVLELNSLGVSTRRADRAELTIGIEGSGPDPAAARRSYEGKLARIRAAVRAAGGEIEVREFDEYGMMGYNTAGNIGMTMADTLTEGYSGSGGAEIRLRNAARLDQLQREVLAAGAIVVAGPAYYIENSLQAERAARQDAIVKARAEADAYAASLNMRVVRMVRLTERTTPDFNNAMTNDRMMALVAGASTANGDPDVETYALLGVDFVLAPR